jgi:putative lipoic acid-binding regulatory protein
VCLAAGRERVQTVKIDEMSTDHAGKLLGWSLSSGVEQRRIHDLVSFPCVFRFTAVADAGFVDALLDRVARVLGRDVAETERTIRASTHGAYESVTLNLWVSSGDEVYSIYEAMHADTRIRYLL